MLVNDGKSHELNMLSELSSCGSCVSVMNQFINKFPNVQVSMVSTKNNRMERKYINENSEKEVYRNRWRKK